MSLKDLFGSGDPEYGDGYGVDPSSNDGSGGFSIFGPWSDQYGQGTTDLPFAPPGLTPDPLQGTNTAPLVGSLPLGTTGFSDPSGGGGFMQKLFGNPQGLANAASVLGSFSSGQKANRLTQGNFSQGYDRNMLAAQQARNQNESDAMRKLAQTNYILNGTQAQVAPSLLLNGGQHSTYAGNVSQPTPISDAQKQGASTLQAQLLQRLAPGGSYTPQPLSSYATPSTSENIGNYASLGLGALGTIASLFGGN